MIQPKTQTWDKRQKACRKIPGFEPRSEYQKMKWGQAKKPGWPLLAGKDWKANQPCFEERHVRCLWWLEQEGRAKEERTRSLTATLFFSLDVLPRQRNRLFFVFGLLHFLGDNVFQFLPDAVNLFQTLGNFLE